MSSSIDDIDDEIFAQYQAKIDRLHDAMRCWMHQYAGEFCDKAEVEKYQMLIAENGGTLNFIAKTIRESK